MLATFGTFAQAQNMRTVIVDKAFLKNARFKAVRTMDVGLIGHWDYPDGERLERFARAEARRLLPGVVYRADWPEGEESKRFFREGSHLRILIDVQLAWSPDAGRNCSGANIRTTFDVAKEGAEDNMYGAGGLQDVTRTQAQCVIGVSRQQLTESCETGITKTLELLADGFFESR
jgi:hypothetical protein